MQTTITLDEDVAAAVDNFSRQEGVGISEAVNRLIRQVARKSYAHPQDEIRNADRVAPADTDLRPDEQTPPDEILDADEAVFPRKPYVHRTVDSGLRMDVSNIGEVLEFLDATDDR